MPVIVNNDWVIPLNSWAYLSQYYKYKDTLYMVMYCQGFDNTTGNPTNSQYNVYLFESTDDARNWKFTALILSINIEEIANTHGWAEPCMIYDGSKFRMLLRTGSKTPLYITSTEDLHIWVMPYKFADFGVKPQLCLLENGVLVASHGRPGIQVKVLRDKLRTYCCTPFIIDGRAETADDSLNYSCCYTSMVPISRNKLLIFYSDFKTPVDGREVKALVCRKLIFQ